MDEAICFDIKAEILKEYKTPALGTHKIGLGVEMLGDMNKIIEVYGSKSKKSSRSKQELAITGNSDS